MNKGKFYDSLDQLMEKAISSLSKEDVTEVVENLREMLDNRDNFRPIKRLPKNYVLHKSEMQAVAPGGTIGRDYPEQPLSDLVPMDQPIRPRTVPVPGTLGRRSGYASSLVEGSTLTSTSSASGAIEWIGSTWDAQVNERQYRVEST